MAGKVHPAGIVAVIGSFSGRLHARKSPGASLIVAESLLMLRTCCSLLLAVQQDI
jgi:hypothetical protein